MQTHPDDQYVHLLEEKPTPGIIILPQGKVLPPTSIPELFENLPKYLTILIFYFSIMCSKLSPNAPSQTFSALKWQHEIFI